jgi:hypothetical protein
MVPKDALAYQKTQPSEIQLARQRLKEMQHED